MNSFCDSSMKFSVRFEESNLTVRILKSFEVIVLLFMMELMQENKFLS